MRLLLLLSVVTVSACGGMAGFYRPGATQQDFYNEVAACEAATTPQWSYCSGSGCDAQNWGRINARNRCMQVKGWTITRKEPKFVP